MTSAYAHRRPFLTAAEMPTLPYLGGPEDRIRSAFTDTYLQLRAYMRGNHFAEHLVEHLDTPTRAMAYIDGHLLDAQIGFQSQLLPTLEQITGGGAARGRLDILGPITKAAGSAEPERRTRFRFLDHDTRRERRVFTGPRLSGLQPTSRSGPRSFNAPPNHIEAARNLGLRLVTDVTSKQRKQIRTLVTQSITRAIPVDDLGVRISHVVGLFPRWQAAVNRLYASMLDNDIPKRIADIRVQNYADELLEKRGTMIARTELMRAMNIGRWAGWHDLAEKGYLDPATSIKQWTGADDRKQCAECDYLSDPMGDHKGGVTVVGIDTPFETEFGPVIMPPAHPHCFPAGTVVSGPRVTAGMTRAWKGELTVLVFAGGEQLSCTPNHPVLTAKGFVAAGLLNEGDYVVGCSVEEWETFSVDPHDVQIPTVIEEVVATVGEANDVTAVTVPVAAEDFHGDGVGSEIAVIYADRFVADRGKPALKELISQECFGGKEGSSLLNLKSASSQALDGKSGASNSVVSSGSVATVLFGGTLSHHQPVGGENVSPLDSSLDEDAVDGVTTDVVSDSESVLRLPPGVTFKQIVKVRREPFQGHVYNLQTTTGWYIANGVIVHNCRCGAVIKVLTPSGASRGGDRQTSQAGTLAEGDQVMLDEAAVGSPEIARLVSVMS